MSPRILGIAAGAVLALVAVWFLIGSVFGGGSDVTLAYEAENGVGDLYLIDSPEEAENPSRDNRILRDVALSGSVREVDGNEQFFHQAFRYEHDGGALFAYRPEDDDEWVIALLDGGEVVEIDEIDQRPSLLKTGSGLYLTDDNNGSCSIFRLSGRESDRVARADYCTINGAADVAVLAERRSSDTEISILDLGSDEQTTVADFKDIESLTVSYSPDNRSMMLSSGSFDDPETMFVDLSNGTVLTDADTTGYRATNGGFFGYEFDSSESSLTYYMSDGETQEVLTADGVDVIVDPSGSKVAILETDAPDTILYMADIGSTGIGTLNEVEVLRNSFNLEFIDDGRLLVIDEDGVVSVSTGETLDEIGELNSGDEFSTPTIAAAGRDSWLVSLGETVGVVSGGSNFKELDDLESVRYGIASSDGRWMAVVGSENVSGSETSVLLVDRGSLEASVIDEDDSISGIQFSDGFMYYEANSNGDTEVRRVKLGLEERPEDLTDGVEIYLPGEPNQPIRRGWDIQYWSFN